MVPPNFFTAVTVAALFLVLQNCNPAAAQDCGSLSSCGTCLDESCGWWAAADTCIDTCGIIANTSCYTLQDGATSDSTCSQAAGADADLTICDDYTNCSSCVGQVLSDGVNTCEWYPAVNGSSSYCSSTCDVGGCGVTECPACENYMACNDCLSEACAWVPVEGCIASCDLIADTGCFTSDSDVSVTTRASSVDAICTAADDQKADAALCSSKTDCSTCVSSTLTDGTTTCQWFVGDGSSADYCASGCGMSGCGETTCSAQGSDTAPTDAPPSAARSASLAVTALLLGSSAAWISRL